MSLLGNLYLRITSKKIQERTAGVQAESIVEIARQVPEGSTLKNLLSSVSSLSGLVQKRMQGLLVADALEDIMSTLQKVKHILYSRF